MIGCFKNDSIIPFQTLTPRSSLQNDWGFGILAPGDEIMANEHDCLVAMD